MRKPVVALFVISGLMACNEQVKWVDNTLPAWYKNQIIYNLDVKTFKDSDGDGVGDFKGLTSKLAYFDSLKITALWIAPFHPSPLQDDGYDVADYLAIDKRLGTKADFDGFVKLAKRHHLKIIMDVVLNHTSIGHPWFRSRPGWYVWSAKRPSDWNKGMGFPETEKETWRRDSVTGWYFFHRFYRFQPDLNYQNVQVPAEAQRILNYWLKQGVDGFRLDAVPFIIDDPRPSAEHPEHDFYVLHNLARGVRKVKPDAMLLGEANVKPEEINDYFSKRGEGLDMMLNFEVNEFLFYALASGDAQPLEKALQVTAKKPGKTQWVYFLRNHDEIDLGKLSKSQIKRVFTKMGPDTNMQLYKRGIRRRLAPMLNNNQQMLKQAYALMLALPGTPVLRYGDEIGMGDELRLKERLSIRTPMQWDSTKNGGFSTARHTFRPVISSAKYGYSVANVQRQLTDTNSLLNFVRKMIALRKAHPEIGQGRWMTDTGGNKHCLIINYAKSGSTLLAVFNFSDNQQSITLPVEAPMFKDLISRKFLRTDAGNKLLLSPNSGYWLVKP